MPIKTTQKEITEIYIICNKQKISLPDPNLSIKSKFMDTIFPFVETYEKEMNELSEKYQTKHREEMEKISDTASEKDKDELSKALNEEYRTQVKLIEDKELEIEVGDISNIFGGFIIEGHNEIKNLNNFLATNI